MKILHVINNLDGGGAEKLLSQLLPMLHKDGCEIQLLLFYTSKQATPFAQAIESSGIVIHRLNFPIGSFVLPAFSVVRFIAIHAFDAVHFHLFPGLYIAGIAARLTRVPIFYTEHGTDNRRQRFALLRLIDRWMYNSLSRVVAISDDVHRALIQKGCKPTSVITITNGIRLTSGVVAKTNTPLVFGMAGRFEYPKDQATVIRAIALMKQPVKLILAGSGSQLEYCKKLVVTLGIQNKVTFLGFIDDIQSFYSGLDIHVFSSVHEGFGLTAAESMAAALPNIISDIPALKSIVGPAGVVFSTGNAADLANKMNQLMNDTDLYRSCSVNALNRVKSFDIQHTVKGYEKLYQSI
jgi:glycosyltransferase involved in cell wall biosynthesis